MKTKVGEAWCNITRRWCKIGANWRKITAGWVKVSGVWRSIIVDVVNITRGGHNGNHSYYLAESGYIEIYAKDSLSINSSIETTVTEQAVDLTGVNQLKAEIEFIEKNGTSYLNAFLIASTAQMAGSGTYDARVVWSTSFGKTIKTLDVSALNGEFYIRCHAQRSAGGDPANAALVRLWRLWLNDTLIWEG